MSLAIVTGAASGIGAEVARRLDRRGHTVVCVDRTDGLAAGAARATSPTALGVGCDLSDPGAVADLSGRIAGEWAGDLAVLVCNAGIIVPRDVEHLTGDVIDAHLDVMLRSPMHLITAAVPGMLARGDGHVMATVSMGGIIALPGSAAYSAAKSGMRAFLSALNAEVAGRGVHVSGFYPSAVDTPMLRREAASGGSALNFLGSVRSVDDVADAYDEALEHHRLENYVPWSDSITSRLIAAKPSLIPRIVPTLNRIGEKGRARYLASPVPVGGSPSCAER